MPEVKNSERAQLLERLRAKSQRLPKLDELAEQTIEIVGLECKEIEVKGTAMIQTIITVKGGKQYADYHKSTQEFADEILSALGAGPYSPPIKVEVLRIDTKWGGSFMLVPVE